ncbi:MAG: hypothetical protein NE328_14025, partial [Lentisphaeraceae bacterium]|nr:hypothetical protein [Lentisphaeraceae bacterium]
IAELPFTLAELQFVLKEEFVYTLEDLIRRRFPIILLKKLSEKEIEHIKDIANKYLSTIGKESLIEN